MYVLFFSLSLSLERPVPSILYIILYTDKTRVMRVDGEKPRTVSGGTRDSLAKFPEKDYHIYNTKARYMGGDRVSYILHIYAKSVDNHHHNRMDN